ncbi:MAG: hypothetical protein AAF399_03745 [Bacteroidota bacterium]
MKSVFTAILLGICCLPVIAGNAQPDTPPRNICQLYGAVFIETVAAFADYRVYVNDIESFADLVVYKQDTRAFADRPGHWYVTDTKAFAVFVIYVEEVEGFADFSIAYTTFQTAAGCN